MPATSPEWLTPAQVAQQLGMSRRSVYRWAESGDPALRVRRVGPGERLMRIHRSVLDTPAQPAAA